MTKNDFTSVAGRATSNGQSSPFDSPPAQRKGIDDPQKRIEKWAARQYPVTALEGLPFPWARAALNQIIRFNAKRDPTSHLPELIFTGDKVAAKATDEELARLGPELTRDQIEQLQIEAAAMREDSRTQVRERAKMLTAARNRDQADDRSQEHRAGPGGLFLDITAALNGTSAVPTVLRRGDGKCLFYKGKGNVIYGDPDTAKTWIALAAGAEVLCDGGRFAFLDLDHNGAETIVDRLRMLGVPLAVLRDTDRFLYVDPIDAQHVTDAVAELVRWRPGMVTIDSMGELLPMFGADSNSSDEFTGVNRAVVTPLARAEAAVVVIDHMAKNAESRRLGTVGAYGKVRAVNGTMVRVFKTRPFIPGYGGVSSLWVHKDRSGNVLRETVAEDNQEARADNLRRWGVFEMTSAQVSGRDGRPRTDANGHPEERLRWTITPPGGSVDVPDPRRGGRPRGGISVVGSPEYDSAVTDYLTALCRLRREGRATGQTNKTEAGELIASVLGLAQPSREPWAEAWNRWKGAGRPDDPVDVEPVTPTNPMRP